MKKIFLIIIVLFGIILSGCTNKTQQSTIDKIKERDYLIVGVKYDVKPFGYFENGELKGLDIDIAKQIAKTILQDENKIKFVEVTSEDRITKLMSEEIDIIVATMTDTQQRREVVDFSSPYYISGQAILCKKNSNVKSAAELTNNKTVVVLGSTAEKTLRQFYRKNGKTEIVNSYRSAFDIVKNEPNACMISDEGILLGFVSDNQGYIIFNKKLTTEPYAVAMRKDDSELKDYVNQTIKQLESTGELDQITKRWVE